jgi:hypothetical protein
MKKYQVYILLICCLSLLYFGDISAQNKVYVLDARNSNNTIREGHIEVQPHLNAANQYGVNSSYFTKNGAPWFPLMGEFHFIRYPHEYWEEEIVKMKSAGLSIVATYIFWNAHENPKDTWNWTKDLNLRKFVELCQKHDMLVWLRIGPWAHGEQLHGGHPDWINKMREKRSNDAAYIKESTKLYHQIGIQTKGLYYKDGGPIIGVQLENEYAKGDETHVDVLKEIAIKNNIIPVYFTITGNTVFKDKEYGFIPLQGGYPYRGWEKGGGGPTKDFLYGNDQWILTDALGKLYYDTTQYPKGLCEQGCGSQMTYRNRFTVAPHVIEAHLQNQIGRGMNLIGYYMFHGGTQVPGLKEPGYPESYDFQAPISEFGLLRPSYKYLKVLHNFINDFGKDIAKSTVVAPNNPIRDENNTKDLRYVARINGNAGFLFLGNTQVRIPMPDKKAKFKIELPNETLEFPRNEFLLKGQTTAILPFNMALNSAILKYATAQPLSKLSNEKEDILFLMQLEDVPVELAFDMKTIKEINVKDWNKENVDDIIYLTKETHFNEPIELIDQYGKITKIQILTRAQAENSWRMKIQGKESLVITKADLMDLKDRIELRQLDQTEFSMDVYPRPENDFSVNELPLGISDKGIFRNYLFKLDRIAPNIQVKLKNSDKALIEIPNDLPENCSDFIVVIDYFGGSATAKIKDKIVTDHLFHGPTWNIGIKRYMNIKEVDEMLIEIQPWSNKITGVSEELVEKVKIKGTTIQNIEIKTQYSITINTK